LASAFDRLLRDGTLVSFALAIALGWTLYRVASGLSQVVATLFIQASGNDFLFGSRLSEPFTWRVGDTHILTLGPLFRALIEFGVVLAVALFVRSRYRPADEAHFANP
jgi:hypothetical protein